MPRQGSPTGLLMHGPWDRSSCFELPMVHVERISTVMRQTWPVRGGRALDSMGGVVSGSKHGAQREREEEAPHRINPSRWYIADGI